MLGAHCIDRSLRSEVKVKHEYMRSFHLGRSFTFIQLEETALPAPIGWAEIRTDESGTFNIFKPSFSPDNAYRIYKTSHVYCSERAFKFHTFYDNLGTVFTTVSLMHTIIMVDIVRDKLVLLLLR